MPIPSVVQVEDSNGSDLYRRILGAVMEGEEGPAPRGMPTREVRPMVVRLTDPTDALPVAIVERRLEPKLAVVEALSLVAGVAMPDLLCRVAPNYWKFINPATGQLDGPYGPAVGAQMPYILRLLQQDPDSRQAVVTIYGPQHQHTSLDVPCTVSLQFFLRGNRLELVVYMRSQDVWWGWPYDVFQFTVLQQAVAGHFEVEPGMYTHITGSMHAYKRNWTRITECLAGAANFFAKPPPLDPRPFGEAQSEALYILTAAQNRTLERVETDLVFPPLSDFGRWCVLRLGD